MIGDWIAAAPVVLVALVVVFLPGAAALWGVGLRGLALLAAAPLMTTAMIGVAALVLGAVGVEWSVMSAGVALLVLVALSAAAGVLLRSRMPVLPSPSVRWLLPTALAIGVVIGAARLIGYIEDPAAISQTNDAVFHLNAIRFILETGDASSLHVSSVIGGRGFYPAAWHGMASLIVLVSGAGIPLAVNAFVLVIAAVLWPLGIAWLTFTLTSSRTIAAWAGVLSSALQTFPLLLLQWGVLYPNALSTALLPAAVAVVTGILPGSTPGTPVRTLVRNVLLVLVAAAALALAQPSGILAWGLLCVVWFSFWLTARSDAAWPLRITGVISAWVVLAVVWLYLSGSTTGSHWPPFRGKLEVFIDVLLNGQMRIPFAMGVSALMLVGLVVAVRTPALRWFAVAWLGVAGLYVLVAAVGHPWIRTTILGAWYADPYRISALAPLVVIPLAAIGVDGVVRFVSARWRRPDATEPAARGPHLAPLAVLAAGMVVLSIVRPVDMPRFIEDVFDTESRYAATEESFLDPDERSILARLDEWIPAGERVIANPSTGAGFGYMLSGVDVFPRTWATPRTEAWSTLSAHLRGAAQTPEVCEALAAYGDPQFVLDFGPGDTTPGRYIAPGMTGFAGRAGFELIAEAGEASLWQITACAQ